MFRERLHGRCQRSEKLTKLMSGYSEVAGHQVDVQESIASLCSSNDEMKSNAISQAPRNSRLSLNIGAGPACSNAGKPQRNPSSK